MDITCHYTGSAGNLYQVDNFLIDPGVFLGKIKKALGFKLSVISFCLLSHCHGDHARAAKDLIKAGIDVYCGLETAARLDLTGHRVHILEPHQQITLDGWTIRPLPLIHDVENLGFLIAKEDEKLLYAIDTNYIPYSFRRLTHIMLGIDYDFEVLRNNVEQGLVDIERAKRTAKNHMSLQTALSFFESNDMSYVKEIHLLHLSDTNSDAARFQDEIAATTGRPVYIE